MFDLASFDAEIRRQNGTELLADDIQLTRALRGTMAEDAITAFGPTMGMFVGAIGLAMMVLPPLVGGGEQAMTYNGMTMDQFAVHMNMSLQDPLLVAMFEEIGMV